MFLDIFGDPVKKPKEWRIAPLRVVVAVYCDSVAKLGALLDENNGHRSVTIYNVLIYGYIDRKQHALSLILMILFIYNFA